MAAEPSSESLRDLPAALLKNGWVQLFLVIFALLELYNHGVIVAFISTQKGIETRAIADNAALRQKAEAELAEWKMISETQIAKYADRKQRADARKATAEARKAEAEQIIARETANNSEVKAKAEAEAAEGEATIKEQLVIIERERAKQAQRLNQAQATEAEYKAIFATFGNWATNSKAQPNVTCSLFGNC
jgi:hypothetical protein